MEKSTQQFESLLKAKDFLIEIKLREDSKMSDPIVSLFRGKGMGKYGKDFLEKMPDSLKIITRATDRISESTIQIAEEELANVEALIKEYDDYFKVKNG